MPAQQSDTERQKLPEPADLNRQETAASPQTAAGRGGYPVQTGQKNTQPSAGEASCPLSAAGTAHKN